MLLSASTARAQSKHAVMITLLHLARRLSPVPGERRERSHHNSIKRKNVIMLFCLLKPPTMLCLVQGVALLLFPNNGTCVSDR